ncbi:MAG: glycosyltransferase family 2 protein [Bacteroidales bacterium]|nr:glycosyltransferase family 2 protein [Bacteroidales bacterium]
MITIFWILLSIVIYAYIAYPILLIVLCYFPGLFKKNNENSSAENPEVTLFIAAYNEIDFIDKKVSNSLSLNYPKEKVHQVWITDGSTDGTKKHLEKYNFIKVYHQEARNGKTGAINRGMKFVDTPIVIFSDANTELNKESINEIVKLFKDPTVGCVAGEKRIQLKGKDNAVNSGEGFYWKYESIIKKKESELNSVIGAAGELFAIRTNLFEEIKNDTILDDFIISMQIAQKGYKIKYAPNAYATERASLNIKEELKRKVRIAYGGIQSIPRLKKSLNPFINPVLSFQYFSHKLLRWTLVPFAFFSLFFVNFSILFLNNNSYIYKLAFLLQVIFYLFVLFGYLFQSKSMKLKILFSPYYVFIMNLSQIIGIIRFSKKKQSVNWEKSKRDF